MATRSIKEQSQDSDSGASPHRNFFHSIRSESPDEEGPRETVVAPSVAVVPSNRQASHSGSVSGGSQQSELAFMRLGAGSVCYHNEGARMRSGPVAQSPAVHPGDEEDSLMHIPYPKSVSPVVSLPNVRGSFSLPQFTPPETHGKDRRTAGQRQTTFGPGGRTEGDVRPRSHARAPARKPYPRGQAPSRGGKDNAAPKQSRQPARETDAEKQQRVAVALHASSHQRPISVIPKPSAGLDPVSFASRPDPPARPAKKRKLEKPSTNAPRSDQPLPAPAPLRYNNPIFMGLDPTYERLYLPPLANQTMTGGINGIDAEFQLLWGQLERQSRELKEVNGLVARITATLRDYEIEINDLRGHNAAQNRAIKELQRQRGTREPEHRRRTTSFDALSRGTHDQPRGRTTGVTAMTSESRNQLGKVAAAALERDGMSAPRSRLRRGVTVLSLDDDGTDGDENLVLPTPAASFGISIHGGDAVNESYASDQLPASGSEENLVAYVKYLVDQGYVQYQELLDHQRCRPSRQADASDGNPSASQFIGGSTQGATVSNTEPSFGVRSQEGNTSTQNTSATLSFGHSSHGGSASNQNPRSAPPLSGSDHGERPLNGNVSPALWFGGYSHGGNASTQNPSSAPPSNGPAWGHSLLESSNAPREYNFARVVDAPTPTREDRTSRPPSTVSADQESMEEKIAPLLALRPFVDSPGCHYHDCAPTPSLGQLRGRDVLFQIRGGNASNQASSGALPSAAPSHRDASDDTSLADLVDDPAHGHVFNNSRLAGQTRPSNPGRFSVDRASYIRPDWA